MRKYKLLIDLPLLKKGKIFYCDDDTGFIYGEEIDCEGKAPMEHPLRQGLSGYLWLLLTERKYMRKLS